MSVCEIKDLSPACANVYVMGVIIAKGESKQIKSKYENSTKGERGAITFTVRDSKRHFINVNVWGSEPGVRAYDTAFKVGDVVVIHKPKVSEKNKDVNRYVPQTTTPFQLTVNEGHSYIYRESIENQPHLVGLISEPIKSTSLALQLADVCGDGTQREGEPKYVDLLVAVRRVMARTIQMKTGEKSIRDVLLMDTSMESMKMTLWSQDDCVRADKWKPLETILHLVDVRCSYSTFDRSMVLQMAGATIVIENPMHSSRVQPLREYIARIPVEVKNSWAAETPNADRQIDLSTITEVMSVQKIKDLAMNSDRPFTAVVYAVITELHHDPTGLRRPIQRYCLHCNQFIPSTSEYCSKHTCRVMAGPGKNYVDKFDIRMNLSDHSGTLKNCHMYDNYAAHFVSFQLDEYVNLPASAIDQIYWLHMLERRAIKVLVKRTSAQLPFVSVLEINPIDVASEANNLKTY